MVLPVLRPRTVPEILDAAFQVIRARYVLLLTCALLVLGPPLALAAALPGDLRLVVSFAQTMLESVVAATAVVVVSDLYLGHESTLGGVLARVGRRAHVIIPAALLRTTAVFFGTMLLLIPGLLVFVLSFAMPATVMLEGRGAFDSLDRSTDLANGQVMRILAAQGLAYLLTGATGLSVAAATRMLGVGTMTATALAGVAAILVVPFPAVVATVLYYDIRVRKEAFDVQMLLDAVPAA